MKIKSLELYKYKKFKYSNIKKLSWKIDDNIQIIIGSNGSGKSSLLRQLLPIVPIKSEFQKKGKKELKLEHNSSIYKIVSDFSHSNKCHSFIKDNEDLNISNGADIQKDLIEQYFNLTPLKLSILSFDINWSILTPGVRKQYLYNLNPVDLSYLDNSYKHIRKQINKCNNNISMLHERKRKIKLNLLSQAEYKELENTYKYIDNLKKELILHLNTFKVLKSQEKQITNVNKVDINNLKDNINNYIKELHNSLYFNVYDKNLKIDLEYKIKSINQQINNKSNEISNLLQELEKYKTHLKHLSKQEKLVLLRKDLDNKTKYKEKNKIYQSTIDILQEQNFNIYDIKSFYNNKDIFLNNIKNLINNISNFINNENITIDKYLIKKETINLLINKKTFLLELLHKNISKVDFLKKEKQVIEEKINNINKPILPNKCIDLSLNKSCTLYKTFEDKSNLLNNQLDKFKVDILYTNKLNIKYKKYIDILSKKIDRSKYIYNNYNKFSNIFNDSSFIYHMLKINNIDINIIYKYNIDNLNNILLNVFIELEKIIEYLKICEDIDNITIQLNNVNDESKVSVDFIKSTIKDKEFILLKNQQQLKTLEDKKNIILNKLDKINNIEKIINTLYKYNDNLLIYIENEKIDKGNLFFNIIIEEIENYLNKIITIHSDLSKKLKEQEFLKERLNKEVINIVNGLYKTKNDLINIEKVLKNLIILYISEFINKLINISNFFLDMLCTYTFQLEKVIDINNFNFKFKIKIGDIVLNDITECSDGQKDMLKLSINLALIILLNLKNYPITIDEIDKTFDEKHKEKLLDLLKYILDKKIISQIFIVNHHAVFYGSFIGETIVLNENNITCPEFYNNDILLE